MALRSLSTLLEDFGDTVWRADALAHATTGMARVLPSGHATLDAQLPGGGWPVGALCELLQAQAGQAEWRLLLPALRTLAQTVALVGAPFAPFGPGLAAQGLDVQALLWVQADALAQRLWAAEQLLRCAGVDALLLWLPQARADHLRRLQQAALAHSKLLWVMRPASAQHEASPAALRLLLGATPMPAPTTLFPARAAAARAAQTMDAPARSVQLIDAPADALALSVQILKRRGPPLAQPLLLSAHPAALRALCWLQARHSLREPTPAQPSGYPRINLSDSTAVIPAQAGIQRSWVLGTNDSNAMTWHTHQCALMDATP